MFFSGKSCVLALDYDQRLKKEEKKLQAWQNMKIQNHFSLPSEIHCKTRSRTLFPSLLKILNFHKR